MKVVRRSAIAQSNWLIDKLYSELHGLFKTIGQEKPDQNDRQLAAMTLSGLINGAISFPFKQGENGRPKQRAIYYELVIQILFA